jgi:soluble lytic murein transglycosylase-like protein
VSRAAVAMLAASAVLLVADGSSDGSTRARVSELSSAPAQAEVAERIVADLRKRNPALSEREVERILAAVMRCGDTYGLDPELVTAVLGVESSARPWAISPKGAVGLMQVMPYMFEPLALAGNLTTIESNIEAGCVILSDNIRRLGENDGILAYFWGARIRGVSYLHRVRQARAALREPLESRS